MFTAILHLALQQAFTCCLRIYNLLLSSLDSLNTYNTDMLCLALLCAFCDEHVNFPPACTLRSVMCIWTSAYTTVSVLKQVYSLTLSPFPLLPHFICHGPNLSHRRAEMQGPRADNPASAGAAGSSSQRGTIWYLIQPDSTMPFVSSLLLTDSIYRHLKFEYNQIEITQNAAPGVADCLKRPCF